MSNPFGAWLEEQIETRGWGITEAARQMGVRHGLLRHWIDGTRNASASSMAKIAEGLNLPVATVYEAAGRLPPGDAPDPNSNYATMRGLIDAIDWDAHPEWMIGLVDQLRALAREQARLDAELDAEITGEDAAST